MDSDGGGWLLLPSTLIVLFAAIAWFISARCSSLRGDGGFPCSRQAEPIETERAKIEIAPTMDPMAVQPVAVTPHYTSGGCMARFYFSFRYCSSVSSRYTPPRPNSTP